MKHSQPGPNRLERWQVAGYGLYVHWPFCQSKCPYCDFNSHVAAKVDQDEWVLAYLSELRRLKAEAGDRRLSSIFFGGGTPSLMTPQTVAAIIDEATQLWAPANDIEITLEANPTSAEIEKFRAFQLAGVNRVSIGVQAMDDEALRLLGRMHGSKEALAAIEMAGAVFDRFSFDLIYARQNQSLAAWEVELKAALAIGAQHMSLYQLTIEPGTIFGARHDLGQLRGLPDEDVSADMYELTQAICEGAGLPAYETSNHASAGAEARHNLIYWRSGDFAAIGPGAHGRLTSAEGDRRAFSCIKAPGAWLQACRERGSGEEESNILTREEVAEEFLVMGLRLRDGIDLNELEDLTKHRITESSIAYLEGLSMVSRHENRLIPTSRGRILLNSLLSRLEIVPA